MANLKTDETTIQLYLLMCNLHNFLIKSYLVQKKPKKKKKNVQSSPKQPLRDKTNAQKQIFKNPLTILLTLYNLFMKYEHAA